MKKIAPIAISILLALGTAACENPAKTSADAPNATDTVSTQAPDATSTAAAQNDAQSEVRRRQLNADIAAREKRNNATGGDTDRATGDLESEVRSKLEANIPNGALAVKADQNGTVTVSGTVAKQDQLAKIAPLAKEIKGVKAVDVKATVGAAKN
jgi:hyperosmotically inducible periplasmic protein